MDSYLYWVFLLVSFGASIVGSICGIGGGVITKPVLDAFGVLSVASISFLSGCTVLVMACYSVTKSHINKESLVDMRMATPMGIGAALGGIIGKWLFGIVSGLFVDKNMVGAVQAACLMVVTMGTLIYTLRKAKIKTRYVTHSAVCVVIGLVLGILSSFLGIGGGPINLVVLYYFFSMETKVAAQNSLYIIMFSQLASLISTLVTGTLPEFQILLLVLMSAGGLLGGECGRRINKKIAASAVEKLFIAFMALIIVINVFNIFKFIA